MVLPVSRSIGSIPVSFELRFGFDAIFAAIGFVVVVVRVVVGLPCALVAPDPATIVELDADFVGLPLDVCLTVVDFAGLPALAGLLVVGFIGFTAADAFLGPPPCARTTAGDSVRDAAATSPRIVAESRIRIP